MWFAAVACGAWAGAIKLEQSVEWGLSRQHRPFSDKQLPSLQTACNNRRAVVASRSLTRLTKGTQMKAVCVGIALSVLSFGALAEWVKIEETGDGATYLDKANVKRAKNIVTFWRLDDFSRPLSSDQGEVRSSKTQFQMDCTAAQYKVLYVLPMEGQMGGGSGRSSVNNAPLKMPYRPIAPGTVAEGMQRFVCKS